MSLYIVFITTAYTLVLSELHCEISRALYFLKVLILLQGGINIFFHTPPFFCLLYTLYCVFNVYIA